jgi:cation diffusion facilitator family transporter
MTNRQQLVRFGLFLSVFTVAWNVLEGLIAILFSHFSGSVALFGFGVDSFIESTSGAIIGWRFYYELRNRQQGEIEKAENLAAKLAGSLLLILALYLLIDSGRRLLGFGREPEPSIAGIILTAISLLIMPILARAKLKAAKGLASKALHADAYETIACAWLSATTLAGLLLNAVFGWWWADPVAALVLVPLIAREGLEGLRGEDDCTH